MRGGRSAEVVQQVAYIAERLGFAVPVACSGGAVFGPTEAASTFPGGATEWAVGITSGNQGLILSHS